MKKKIIPLILLVVICGGLGFWFFGRGRTKELKLDGEVEGTIYSHVAEVTGKIIEMNMELGGPVKAGDIIARLDNTDQKYALEQTQFELEKKRLTLQEMLNGAKEEDLDKARNDVSIAEANYRSASASYNQVHDNLERLSRLVDTGGLSQSELDNAGVQVTVAGESLEVAKNQVDKAKEQLSLLVKGADEETLGIAEEDIRETESKIRQMQDALRKYDISANCGGIVISKNYNLGTVVNSGYNIADISADNEKYVVCYVPKEDSMRLSYGQFLSVRYGKSEFQAQVRFIDTKSQYTPKDMQTSIMKNKVSVKVKLLLPSDTLLIPGNRVEVIVTL